MIKSTTSCLRRTPRNIVDIPNRIDRGEGMMHRDDTRQAGRLSLKSLAMEREVP